MSKIPTLAFLTCTSLAQGDLDMATLVVLLCGTVQAALWEKLEVTVVFSVFIVQPHIVFPLFCQKFLC